MKQTDVAIAIIVRGSDVLICQRRQQDVLGGYWEFPGGKCEAGETPQECLVRELREELNLSVTPTEALPIIEHTYPHARVRLHPFLCNYSGEPHPLACQSFIWAPARQLRDYQFPPANDSLIEDLIRRLS